MLNKKIKLLGLVLLLSLASIGCKGPGGENLLLKVNGQEITMDEFEEDYNVFKSIYEKQLGEGALDQVLADGSTLDEKLREDIKEKLIIEEIISQEASKKNIEVTDEELDQGLEEYINFIGDEETFKSYLEESNLTEESFRYNFKKEILAEKFQEDFREATVISDEDAKKYFDENKDKFVSVNVSHILLQTKEEAEEALKRLENENFEDLALELSKDSNSALNGGNIGFISKGSLIISEFEDAAFKLEPGEISEIVETEVGFHIIRVEERRDNFDSLKDMVVEVLREERYIDYIQDLRDKAKIKEYK